MTDTYTVSDVTDDLRELLVLTNVFDANEDGKLIIKDTGDIFKYKLDDSDDAQEIVLFQNPLPRGNYLFLNPFSEGYGKENPASKYFYRATRIALNVSIASTMSYVLDQVLTMKEAGEKDKAIAPNLAVVRMSSVPVGKRQVIYDTIDTDMVDEFKKIFSRVDNELIHIRYMRQITTSKLFVPCLTDDGWDEKFGGDIRKKSLTAFKALLMGVLGITKPEELSQFDVKYDPDMKSAPRFHSTIVLMLKVYSRFNDVLGEVNVSAGKPEDDFLIDLDRMYQIVERFPLAYAIAKHMIQPAPPPKATATSTQTSDTSSLRFTNQGSGGSSRFTPKAIESFGNMGGGLSMGGGGGAPLRDRFAPQPIAQPDYDPLSPHSRSNNPGMGHNSGQGFGGGGGFGFGQPAGGSFGGGGMSMSANAPSNFGFPGTRHRFG